MAIAHMTFGSGELKSTYMLVVGKTFPKNYGIVSGLHQFQQYVSYRLELWAMAVKHHF